MCIDRRMFLQMLKMQKKHQPKSPSPWELGSKVSEPLDLGKA